jgi:hypothetical protein
VVCAVLNDAASGPYRPQSNGEKEIATYFDRDTLQLELMLQLVMSTLKPNVLALEIHK